MSQEDFDKVIVSGVTLGFLSGAAFSDSFYKKGLLLGQNSKDQPRCLEIVSAFPHQLRPNVVKDYESGSELRAVGVYKCRSCIDPERKFSVDDYMTMSIDGVELFFLIEVHKPLSVRQKMFQIRSHTGRFNTRLIRPINFDVYSIDSQINRLYETKNMEGFESISASVRKACDEVEKHAMDKLEQTTDALARTMSKMYACTPSASACNSRKPSHDSFRGSSSTDRLDDASGGWTFMAEASPTDQQAGFVVIRATAVPPRRPPRDSDGVIDERWHDGQD